MKPTFSAEALQEINQSYTQFAHHEITLGVGVLAELTMLEEGKMGLLIQLDADWLKRNNLQRTCELVLQSWKDFLPALQSCVDYEITIETL